MSALLWSTIVLKKLGFMIFSEKQNAIEYLLRVKYEADVILSRLKKLALQTTPTLAKTHKTEYEPIS